MTVELQQNYGPEISVAMSPDDKTLVAAMPGTDPSGSVGTLLEAIPDLPSGPGLQSAPTNRWSFLHNGELVH